MTEIHRIVESGAKHHNLNPNPALPVLRFTSSDYPFSIIKHSLLFPKKNCVQTKPDHAKTMLIYSLY